MFTLNRIVDRLARNSINNVGLPSPLRQRNQDNTDWLDLSHSTNPYADGDANYPDLLQTQIKELYLKLIWADAISKTANFIAPPPETKNLLFTMGSVDGVDLILRAFAEPYQDLICVTPPTFPAYSHWATLADLKVVNVPLKGENFTELDVDRIAADRPKIVFLCDPSNPVGTCLSSEKIVELATKINGLVVVDEAYIEFARKPSILLHWQKLPNLIVLRTLSKAWGLAGARCGIVLADDRLIRILERVQVPFSFSTPAQQAVLHRLNNPDSIYASWEKLQQERDKLILHLSHLPSVIKVFPSETNFVLAVFAELEKVRQHLALCRIMVGNSSGIAANSLRISVGLPEQNARFLQALKELDRVSQLPPVVN